VPLFLSTMRGQSLRIEGGPYSDLHSVATEEHISEQWPFSASLTDPNSTPLLTNHNSSNPSSITSKPVPNFHNLSRHGVPYRPLYSVQSCGVSNARLFGCARLFSISCTLFRVYSVNGHKFFTRLLVAKVYPQFSRCVYYFKNDDRTSGQAGTPDFRVTALKSTLCIHFRQRR
jgi:hypothetical protein